MDLQTILHPTDYSDQSQAALDYAVDLARTFGARLIVLHTVPTLGPEDVSFGEVANQKQPETYRRHLWEDLHRRARITDPHVEVEYVLSEDEPAKAINELAAQRQVDLIVLGTHGRHGLQRLLEGSVAERVIRSAPCPVLVLKPPNAQPTPLPAVGGTELHPRFLYEKSNNRKGDPQK
jgi:nucleotide-binding universal stress UspA family protein